MQKMLFTEEEFLLVLDEVDELIEKLEMDINTPEELFEFLTGVLLLPATSDEDKIMLTRVIYNLGYRDNRYTSLQVH